MNKLFLATKSNYRHTLFKQAKIPFEVIEQFADEGECDWSLPLFDLLKEIVIHKMKHVMVPEGSHEEVAYVLTLDTMGQSSRGDIFGKPDDKQDAVRMIRSLREGAQCGTAFCLEKKIWDGIAWNTLDRIVDCVLARYEFAIEDEWIERYLEHEPNYLSISGGINVLDYGTQFLKWVDGSYGSLMSLPMFQIRVALEKMGFFDED